MKTLLLILIIMIHLILAQEFQVDGELQVSGEIQSPTIDSLQNDINNLYDLIDSLYSIINTKEPIKLITYNMDLILPEEEGLEIVVYDTTFSVNTFEEFIRVELNTWLNYSTGYYLTGIYVTLYFGLSGSEENHGTLLIDGEGTGGPEGYNFTPQLWWTIPIDPQFINQPLRLYITISNYLDHRGGISKLFIWGR